MSFQIVKTLPWRIIYLSLAALILLSLAFFGPSENTKKTPIKKVLFGSKVQGEQETSEVFPPQPIIIPDDQDEDDQKSSSTKVRISVNSTNTNGETSGSANVEVTTNGQTQNFSDAVQACLDGADISIKIDDNKISCEGDDDKVEIKWKSSNNQKSKNETSVEQNIEIDRKSVV